MATVPTHDHVLPHWWLATCITTLGINLFGDGLRDLLDPHRVLSQPGPRMD